MSAGAEVGDGADQIIRLGGCAFDTGRGTLTRDGGLVHLRAKTYALLCHLVRHAGQVVSKESLLDAVWPDVTVTEDSLTQTIRDLRLALGPDGAALVRTVARRGYLLALPEEPGMAASAPLREPRVAVLPFRTLSPLPHDSSLVEGIVEEITFGLARYRSVTVIARHSAFALQTGPESETPLAAAARALEADYVVQGTARRAGRLKLSVSLQEVATGVQVWGQSYDCDDADLLAMQEIIPLQIIQRLVANINDAVVVRANQATSLSAFAHLVNAIQLLRSFGPGVNERARDHLRACIAADPDYGLAHSYLALAEVTIGTYGATPPAALDVALFHAMRGLQLAPDEPRAHRIMALVRLCRREHAAAEQQARRGIALNPHDADSLAQMGYLLTIRGRASEALGYMERALLLNPLHPPYYHLDLAVLMYSLGRYTDAAAHLMAMPHLTPMRETRLAACLALTGRRAEAAAALARAEAQAPGWDALAEAQRTLEYERPEDMAHLLAGIRAAMDCRSD